jgi:hypothetical protein
LVEVLCGLVEPVSELDGIFRAVGKIEVCLVTRAKVYLGSPSWEWSGHNERRVWVLWTIDKNRR